MNPIRLIRSTVDASSLPTVIDLPKDGRRAAKRLRVRASEALLLPIRSLVERAEAVDRDIEELFRNGDADQTRVAAAAANDLALTVASRVSAYERDAIIKITYLCRHRAAFGEMTAVWPAMFDAAIDHECARWGLSRPDQPAQRPAVLH